MEFKNSMVSRDVKLKLQDETKTNQINFHCFTKKIQEITLILNDQAKTDDATSMLDQQKMIHDIRKPLSFMKMYFFMLQTAETVEEKEELTESVLPDILKAIEKADFLIEEFLSKGRVPETVESVPAVELITESLKEVYHFYPQADVEIEFNLNHKNIIKVRKLKALRIFSNLISNAIEAMNNKGKILFKTEDKPNPSSKFGMQWTEFSITNFGSFIESEDLKNIFNEFYTKGKEKGTGLGLAIVNDIVKSYGGVIECFSEKNEIYPEGFVEFRFTLPSIAQN